MPENLTAEEAVAQAAQSSLIEKEPSTVAPAKVEGGDPTTDETPTEEVVADQEETPDEEEEVVDENKDAKEQLWSIFQDPNQLRAFIKALDVNLRADVKEAPQDAKQIAQAYKNELLSEIGPENEFLLEPVLKIINKLTGQIEAKATQRIDELQRETIQKDVMAQYDGFMSANKVSKEIETKMDKLSKQFPANPDIPVKTYLKHLHTLATAEDAKVKNNEKIRENAKNVNLKNLSSNTQAKQEPRPKDYTAQMAVEDAMKGIVRN